MFRTRGFVTLLQMPPHLKEGCSSRKRWLGGSLNPEVQWTGGFQSPRYLVTLPRHLQGRILERNVYIALNHRDHRVSVSCGYATAFFTFLLLICVVRENPEQFRQFRNYSGGVRGFSGQFKRRPELFRRNRNYYGKNDILYDGFKSKISLFEYQKN